jgi:CHAT domain-containing protein
VVASLWVASDVYTPILMDHFYRHVAMGEEKADALRKAKLDLLVEFGDQSSPLFWAGFVMVGDGTGIAFIPRHTPLIK